MKFYLAPLEGITGYLYRRAYQDFFHNVDKYFIPFVEPHRKRDFNAKERNEISPEHNRGVCTVPQILTNQAEDFLFTARALADQGYDEINLNLGCPSGTVVSKGKGSGFLEFPDQLDAFLNHIFSQAPCRISVKTRVGRYEPEEFERLLHIFNQYPLKELIVHPRTREDYYRGVPRWDSFQKAADQCRHPLCYNGDIFTSEDYQRFCERFPQVNAVMLGRGILRNPMLVDEICSQVKLDWEKIIQFHDRIYHDYRESLSGDRPVLFKMKELWNYEFSLFSDDERLKKQLMKVQRCSEYEAVTEQIFRKKL